MAEKKHSNIIKISRPHSFNVGLLVFLIILIYTMYFVVQYITAEHISVYEVEQGSIVRDSVYTGIVIRDEEIIYAENAEEAVISYYASTGRKVGTSTLVYSLSEDDGITDLYTAETSGSVSLSDADYSSLFDELLSYTYTYSDMDFGDLYTFTGTVNHSLTELINTNALAYLQEADAAEEVDLYYAVSPGIITYYTDGYESVTADEVTAEMIEAQDADRTELSDGDTVASGDAIYKLTNNENWQVVISVSASVAEELEESGTVEVEFAKDDHSAWATVAIRQDGDAYLAVLSFTNSMSRYADDRYLTVTLDLDDVSGLKIPNTAITTKEFFLIPKDYITYDDTEDSYALQIAEEDGSITMIYPDIYSETDDYYYVIDDDLVSGSTITDEDGNTYTVSLTASLQGCYNINKGYAVFKQIEILYQSESYTIVAKNTDYGLAQFDYIALNASGITEGQIVN